jgi:hypothetical protein
MPLPGPKTRRRARRGRPSSSTQYLRTLHKPDPVRSQYSPLLWSNRSRVISKLPPLECERRLRLCRGRQRAPSATAGTPRSQRTTRPLRRSKLTQRTRCATPPPTRPSAHDRAAKADVSPECVGVFSRSRRLTASRPRRLPPWGGAAGRRPSKRPPLCSPGRRCTRPCFCRPT